ncbi:MAG TPA: hypothetical protein VNO24_10690 [Blastocatellia bacterium]|nr:hypothetical protein [Blastocatellia bacterium]
MTDLIVQILHTIHTDPDDFLEICSGMATDIPWITSASPFNEGQKLFQVSI